MMGPESPSFCLTAEELAVALSVSGKPDVARGIMQSHFGEIQQEEFEGRLLAAGHSLMSKGLLIVDPVERTSRLASALTNVAATVAQADFSVRFSRTRGNVEESLSYHIASDVIVEHQVKEGVLHFLRIVPGQQQIVDGGIEFLELATAEALACAEADIGAAVLEDAKGRAQAGPEAAAAFLETNGIPQPACSLLAEDLAQTKWRGSALRVEFEPDGRLTSDYGFMLLRGPKRAWLFRVLASEEHPVLRMRPGTKGNFREEVLMLIRKER